MQAARYLKVPMWDLLKQSVWYVDYALIALSAEQEARQHLEERQAQQQKGYR